MKTLISLLIVLIVAFVSIVSGIFYLASKDLEGLIFRQNIEEFSNFADIAIAKGIIHKQDNLTTYLPASFGKKPIKSATNETIAFEVDTNTKLVSESNASDSVQVDLAEFNSLNNPFANTDLWNLIINNSQYRVEEIMEDDQSYYRFITDQSDASDKYFEKFKAEISALIAPEKNSQAEMIITSTEFTGHFAFEVLISKSDYQVKRVKVYATSPIQFDVTMQGKAVENIKKASKKLGEKIPSFKGYYRFENYSYEFSLTEVQFKSGHSIPKNRVLLYLDYNTKLDF